MHGKPPSAHSKRELLVQKHFSNPIKRALRYQELLDDGYAQSKSDLARMIGLSVPRVFNILNLLRLDEEIQSFILSLDSRHFEKVRQRVS